MHLKTRNEFPTSFFVAANCRYVTRVIFSAVLGHKTFTRFGTWFRGDYVQIQHFRSFSYYLHATNSLLQSIRLPLLTMHMLCLSNISLKFSHGLTSG